MSRDPLAAKHIVIGPPAESRGEWRRNKKRRLQFAATGLLAVTVGAAMIGIRKEGQPIRPGPRAEGRAAQSEGLIDALPPPDLYRPLTPEEARVANSDRPVLARADRPAASFVLKGASDTKARALECLAQAVYYEAGSETIDGGRAVAQIVLNRVRYQGYPHSLCGVVYQGSERSTGCQFSFTCDGSLMRVPNAYLWARSRRIASEALAGRVYAPVGHATHYHADYVAPYWADSLDKVAVIGRHIFYRLRGAAGAEAMFRARYAGREPNPPPPPPTAVIDQSLEALTTGDEAPVVSDLPMVEADRATILDAGPTVATTVDQPLAADLARGTLIIGEPGPSKQSSRTEPTACRKTTIRLEPASSTNLSAAANEPTC